MKTVILICAAALAGIPSLAEAQAPDLYPFCLEMGVKGSKPRPVAEQAATIRETGFPGAGYLFWLDDESLDANLKALDAAGLKLYLLQASINLGPKAREPYDSRLPAAIRKLKGRPVTVAISIGGLPSADPAGTPVVVKALRELGDAAADAGVRISVYNHINSWTESVPHNIEVVRKVNHPRVGFNFNLCHWLRIEGNKDPRPLLGANADKLFVVTLNGAQLGATTWTNGLIQPLDRGDFDTRGLVAMLREIGYRGPVALMCFGIPDQTREHLARSMRVWKSWFAPAR
jgi:sugar phosphate isomerase/epimerase